MANLRTCSRCKSTIDESYFSINRKKEYYKTCDTCRNRNKKKILETNIPVITDGYDNQSGIYDNILVGENRDFGGKDLYIDLIPSSSWY